MGSTTWHQLRSTLPRMLRDIEGACPAQKFVCERAKSRRSSSSFRSTWYYVLFALHNENIEKNCQPPECTEKDARVYNGQRKQRQPQIGAQAQQGLSLIGTLSTDQEGPPMPT